MKTLSWIIGLGVVLASGLWFAAAFATERVVVGWLAEREADGWVVGYGALDTGGFPTRFETVFTDLILADPDTGWVWSVPTFTFTQAALRPDQIRADWPEEQSLASPFERLDITSAELWAYLDVRPTHRFAIDASRTVIREMRIDSSLGARTELARGALEVTRVQDQAAQYDVLFEAEGLVPPEEVRRSLDPGGLLPPAMELARYEARMRFDRPWDLTAVEVARPQITELALREMRAHWGELLFRASGDLVVDAEGRATGEIAVRAENWQAMLDMGVRAGALSPGLRAAAERALGFVAGLSGRPEDIDVTLRLDDGFVFFGPLPVGEAPRLLLR